jgi:response regulator of citrate/malate metabolism
MKQLLVTLFLLPFAFTLALAQQPETAAPVESAAPSRVGAPAPAEPSAAHQLTQQLTAKYQLDTDQSRQMLKVQQRKLRTMTELEAFKLSDPVKYRAKLEGLQTGTLNSIRRLLKTPAQVDLFQKTQTEVRIQRATKRKELTQAGASKEAIEDAMRALYTE